MGEIRQSFPGGNRRFKKLLFSTVSAPVLQMQDYQTSLKLEFGKKPKNSQPESYVSDDGGLVFVGPASCGKTTLL